MSASVRIQWLHKKLSENCYPAIAHLSEKFSISRRQALRDVNYLRNKLGAPISYSAAHKGYYYTSAFVLPFILQDENDADFNDVISQIDIISGKNAELSVTQLQFPYTATLEIKDKMTVLNLRSLIVADERHHRYRCEFPSVELFVGIVVSSGANVKIVEPIWLRERLVELAERIIRNNQDEPTKK